MEKSTNITKTFSGVDVFGILKMILFLFAFLAFRETVKYKGLMEIDYRIVDFFLQGFLWSITAQVILSTKSIREMKLLDTGILILFFLEAVIMILIVSWFREERIFNIVMLSWLAPLLTRWCLPFFIPERKKGNA
jgi:hypothetical protein